MNKWIELIVGLLILIGVILVGYYSWQGSGTGAWTLAGFSLDFLHAGWIFLKGAVFWIFTLIGIVLILLGINDLKE